MIEETRQHITPKKRSKIVALVDEDTCTGCEVCIEFCPVDCIAVVKNPNPELIDNVCRVIEDACICCKLCAKECPWECIEIVPRIGP